MRPPSTATDMKAEKLEADRSGREEPNGLRGGGGQETFLPSDEGLDLLWVPLPSPLRPSFA